MADSSELQRKDYQDLIRIVQGLIREHPFAAHPLGDEDACLRAGYAAAGRRQAYIVLAEDTSVELGAPRKDSISMALWTERKGLLEQRLWILGSDLAGLEGQSVSFLQIVMLELAEGSQVDESDLNRIKNLTNRIPGLMTRSMAGKTWIRIDKKLMGRGFSLYVMGQCLHKAYTEVFPEIRSMEIILMTGHEVLIGEFQPIFDAARIIASDNMKARWISEGVVTCDELNCETCEDKNACDTLREVILKKKRMG